MSAKQMLDAVRQLTRMDELEAQLKQQQELVSSLLNTIEELRETQRVEHAQYVAIKDALRCGPCKDKLARIQPGDTVEVHPCSGVTLSHCIGSQ